MVWLDIIVGLAILAVIVVLYILTVIKFPWKKAPSETMQSSFLEFSQEDDKHCYEWEPWDTDKDERTS
jgi:signal peptidase I